MKTIKGPAIFLGQFAGDEAPFNSWDAITKWAADCGYEGVQVPTWAGQLIDLKKAAESKDYCDDFKGQARENGVEVTELSTHLQGQLVAVHPAYDEAFDGFAAPEVRGNPKARQEWAVNQVKMAISASKNMGINAHATFSGALAWPFLYPWPQRPAGLIETAFAELAKRWTPILNHADENGVDICYEIHPGEDLHDGVTFEMFLVTLEYKTQNIGGVIMIEVFNIKLMHGGIIHNGHTHIPRDYSGLFNNLIHCQFDLSGINFNR